MKHHVTSDGGGIVDLGQKREAQHKWIYRVLCGDAGSPDRHLDTIDRSITAVDQWQASHYTKTPSSDSLTLPEEQS